MYCHKNGGMSEIKLVLSINLSIYLSITLKTLSIINYKGSYNKKFAKKYGPVFAKLNTDFKKIIEFTNENIHSRELKYSSGISNFIYLYFYLSIYLSLITIYP
jgi:hypothetical protein